MIRVNELGATVRPNIRNLIWFLFFFSAKFQLYLALIWFLGKNFLWRKDIKLYDRSFSSAVTIYESINLVTVLFAHLDMHFKIAVYREIFCGNCKSQICPTIHFDCFSPVKLQKLDLHFLLRQLKHPECLLQSPTKIAWLPSLTSSCSHAWKVLQWAHI